MARFSDTTDLQAKDFTTRTRNMWQTDDLNLYPEASICEDSIVQSDNIY